MKLAPTLAEREAIKATLKPCPFCGGAELLLALPTCRPETRPYDPSDRLYPMVACMGCGAHVNGQNEDYAGVTAAEAWNRRTVA